MTTVTLRDTGVVDTRIPNGVNSNSNFGTENFLGMSRASSGAVKRSLLKFPIPVPGGVVTVSNAVLKLHNNDAVGSTAIVEVRRLLSDFVLLEATWNKRNTSTNWNVAGALTGTDVDATVIATGVSPTTAETQFDLSGAGFTQYVQDVMNGSADYGIIASLVSDLSYDGEARRHSSSRDPTATKRPTLVLEYTAMSVSASIGDVSVDRTDGTATVPVTLSGPAPVGGVTVNYATQDDTATAPAYYTAATGTLTFAEGESTKNVTVSITP